MEATNPGFLSLPRLDEAKIVLERKDAAAVLVGDQAAQRIAAAWPNVPKSIDEKWTSLVNEAQPELFPPFVLAPFYWEHVKVEIADVVLLSGVSSSSLCDQKLNTLRGMFLIFPDGTLASATKQLLEGVVDLGRFDKATATVRLDERDSEE